MKFKSKSLISIILSIMMVMSMILVAIPANAAVIDSEPVGAGTYYLWYTIGDNTNYGSFTKKVEMTADGSNYVASFEDSLLKTNATFVCYINTDSSTITTGLNTLKTSTKGTYDDTCFHWLNVGGKYQQSGYYYIKSQVKSSFKVKVTYNPTGDTIALSKDDGTTPTKYTVNYGAGGTGSGSVTAKKDGTTDIGTSPASVAYNSSVTFTATAGTNSTFDGWYSDSSCTIAIPGADQSSTTYTKTVTAPTNVYAKFTSTATPTTTYYLGGRIVQNGTSDAWIPKDNTNYPFIATETPGLYKYVSSQTPAVWSQTRNNLKQYFYVHTGKDNSWYGNSGTTPAELTSANQELSLAPIAYSQDTNEQYLTYINSTDTTGNVIFYLDTNNGMKLYYEVEGGSTTKGAFEIKDKTAVNGSLSFSADGKTAGTADAGNTVNVTAKPYAGFTCSGITVSYTNKTTSETVTLDSTGSGNNYSFVVPADLTTDITTSISVAATFTLDKVAYIKSQGDGLWIDVAPNENDSTATLIKWNNYSGSNHETTSTYIFYVPKNVDLSKANIYNGYGNAVTLNGTSIPADDKAEVFLAKDVSYTTLGGVSTTVKVMQGSTNAMFLYTTKAGVASPLPTTKSAGTSKKDVVRDGGVCKTMTNETSEASFSSAMALESVKGRGNSSWQASNEFFGKYAFNMKLAKKTNLFNIDTTKLPDGSKASGSKSYCLLANNADESMLRNALTYQLASEIGLLYSPEFSFVDIYDNGEYLGQYLVTEKVDIGSSKLIKGNSFEDINEDAVKEVTKNPEATIDKTTTKTTYSYTYANNKTYTPDMRYANVAPNGATSDKNKYPYDNTETDPAKQGKYLLEFEISDRVNDEPCYFVSPQGQNVVIKSPEYATKEQVEFIANKFAKMEEVAFTANASKTDLSAVMDVESFAKMYLIQEFTANLDAASTSYYITFDCSQTNPVFVANPVWDYDMALGQFEKPNYKFAVGEQSLSPDKTDAWLAKYKRMDNSEENAPNKYSIQSQLASQNSAFKTEIRNQWEGTNGFYANIQKYIGDNGQIKTWFDKINASAEMNEARWGFIASDLLTAPNADWGLKDTGANHTAAVNYLNTWVNERATWLNGEFKKDSEYAPYTPSKPTIAAYNADLSATITSPINAGTDFVIKVTSEIESGVKYRLYEGSSSAYLYENKDGVFALKATEAGKKTYTVKAVYGSTESEASSAVSVTVIAPADLEGVSLSVSNTSVNVNEEFTLTATAAPVGVTGVKYTFYKDNVAIASDITSNTYTTKLTVEGTADYKVKATANGKSFESSVVSVTAVKVAQVHDFRVYFKCASAPAYKPYVSLDGAKAFEMTRGTELGKNYAGTLTFFWYYADFSNVDSADTHTLTFTSKRTKLNATITNNFANSEYYLAVDNLMTGTEVVDLTGSPVYVRNFFHSATNLVYSGVGTDKTLGFTNINGTRYKMGTYIDENGLATFSIKSATTMQMLTAELATVSETQQAILDVNLDGKVDIKDATLMQMALVS